MSLATEYSPSSLKPQPRLQRPRRQLRACNACHRRKVHCDAIGQQTCSNCEAVGNICRFDIVEALSRRNKDRRQGGSLVTATSSDSGQIGQANQSAPLPSQKVTSVHVQQRPTPTSGLDHVLDAVIQDQSNEKLVDNVLVDFYQQGIHPQTWTLFNKPSDARMCYIGISLSNLSHLVRVERCGNGSALHYTIPRIRRIVSWKPGADLPEIQLRSDLTQNLTLFPAQDVCDTLVDAFFTEINPGFPVIGESEFRASYTDEEPPPLLLYQAVLLGGARVCQHPKVVKSRSFVKAVLYQRAKTLWDVRFENDRVTLVQAALIFSWHVETADNVSAGSYYWISVACGTAYGLGMHRNLTQSSSTVMPQPARQLERSKTAMMAQSVNNVSNLDALLTPGLEYPTMDWDLFFSALHPDNTLEHTDQDWSSIPSWIHN